MRFFQRILSLRFFQRPSDLSRLGQIIWWWEIRRIAFNLIVGSLGIVTCLSLFGLASISERFFPQLNIGGGAGSPFLAILAVFFYGVAANVCYTGGWLCEIAAKKIWQHKANGFGEISFAFGITLSILITLVPVFFGFIFLIAVPLIHHS